MKPLDKMNSVEKANLLHGLFPDEIPALLEYVKGICQSIKDGEAEERAKGGYGIITFDFWLQLVNDAERRIDRYGKQMHKRAGLFADQLFDGNNALYMQHCLKRYIGTRQHENQLFTGMVRVLFKTDDN